MKGSEKRKLQNASWSVHTCASGFGCEKRKSQNRCGANTSSVDCTACNPTLRGKRLIHKNISSISFITSSAQKHDRVHYTEHSFLCFISISKKIIKMFMCARRMTVEQNCVGKHFITQTLNDYLKDGANCGKRVSDKTLVENSSAAARTKSNSG